MVVEFKKGHNNSKHIDENKLDKNEAIDFIKFLQEEIDRHKEAVVKCYTNELIEVCNGNVVLKTAWASSMSGHMEDIKATQRTIDLLKSKWGIQ